LIWLAAIEASLSCPGTSANLSATVSRLRTPALNAPTVTIADIALFEGEGNYARVHFGSNRPLIRTSLNALEARLDPALFFRASRRHLFNLRFVERVDAGVDDGYTVTLRGGATVTVSRRQARQLREQLGL